MLRQLSRLILYVLAGIRNFVFKYPGASVGFLAGGIIGFVLGLSMVKFGFPAWALPVNTLVWAVVTAPVVKTYLDRLR